MVNVSIVVPAYNAEGIISDCISSLLAQDHPSQIIVVDDGSTDGTAAKVEGSEGVMLIKQENKGPAAARNVGWKAATGDIIIFTDSDCIAPKDWVSRLTAELEEEDVVGGGIEPESRGTLAEEFEQARRDRLYGRTRRHVTALPSCNLAFKRKVLEDSGGFDEDYKRASAEDYELCSRIGLSGTKILYEPAISIIHKHSTTVSGIFHRAYLHGTEIMRYRRGLGGDLLTELFRMPAKALLIPYFALTRYPLRMAHLGLAYETLSLLGNIKGFMTYWVGL